MVCAADCRLGKPGGYQEEMYGDGGAAFLLGSDGVIASIEGTYSVSYDFMDHWRSAEDTYNRSWEDRWIRDEGYSKFISESISGLMREQGLQPADISKVAYPCLYVAAHGGIGRKLGFEPTQIQDHMFTTIGHAGTSYPLLGLVAALEDSKPGDKIIVASYGNGSDAILLQVTDAIEKARDRRGVKKHLESKKDLGLYEKYVTFREVLNIDTGGRGEEVAPTQASILFRERKMILGLVGSKCRMCGMPQYPPQEICANPKCGAVNEMDDYRFSNKRGKLFTYTGDVLAFSPSPPAIYGMVDFDEGGRWLFDLTDCEIDALEVGLPVEMSLRRKYHDAKRGVHVYYWKATPIRA
jgi:3-hydroxy-3-methylglutaryl CoA synthase